MENNKDPRLKRVEIKKINKMLQKFNPYQLIEIGRVIKAFYRNVVK